MWRHLLSLVFLVTACATPLHAQPAVPPRVEDLPRLAKSWPPAWAALVHEIVPAQDPFEKTVLDKVEAALRAEPPTSTTYEYADIVLAAALRHHQSIRRTAPLADNPAAAFGVQLQDRLENVRKDWLNLLRTKGEVGPALKHADHWLPVTAKDSPVRSAILVLWTDQANAALEKPDPRTARGWLDRIEDAFEAPAAAEEIRKRLRERADTLVKEAQAMPDTQAIRTLEEALVLWPRLPEARDALERRKGTFRTLVIGVRTLPEYLSPASASTIVEKQAVELLFDRLFRIEPGKRYIPQLAGTLPTGSLASAITLRRDVYWSSGERLTAADVRHTALLMNQPTAPGRSGLWRDYLEAPRLEGNPFHVQITYRQGLLDPLAPLTFHVLPHMVRGKQLDRADDAAFAKAPVGSGPFQYVGRKVDGGKIYAVFQANPHDLRGGARSLREIRMVAWADLGKDLPKPLPQMILDAPQDQLAALKALGYTEVRRPENAEVQFLAVNQRRPTLAPVSIRRAIAHAIDRQALLKRHFGADAKEKDRGTVNGLFPRGSWAACPAPRVPEELHQEEQARSFARQAKKEVAALAWTLKYPQGDTSVQKACEEIAGTVRALFQDADIKADVKAIGLAPHDLRKAIEARDYDLAYTSAANLDDPVRLALFFDPDTDATRGGGSNYLGYDGDIKLQELLQAALKHRQFSVAQAHLQAVHAHLYETMPAVPLWQLDIHVLAQPSLRLPALEAQEIFARIREW